MHQRYPLPRAQRSSDCALPITESSAAVLPPTAARMFAVAAGLAAWTPQEDAWLLDRPRWIEYELRLRARLKASRGQAEDDNVEAWLGGFETLREEYSI